MPANLFFSDIFPACDELLHFSFQFRHMLYQPSLSVNHLCIFFLKYYIGSGVYNSLKPWNYFYLPPARGKSEQCQLSRIETW